MIILASGWFDPIHVGHVEYLQLASEINGKDKLIVIVNNDKQAVLKKGKPFMSHEDRLKIVENLKCVDEVFLSIDEDMSVCKSIQAIAQANAGKKIVFAKGGDRKVDNIPEKETCERLGIEIIDGLGNKIRSSRDYYNK